MEVLVQGKKVAIVGIGGLGHLGIQWAKALGADVYAISHSDSKLDDAEKLGVKKENFIICKDNEETAKKWKNTFDLIVCTSHQADLPVDKLYFPVLKAPGSTHNCWITGRENSGLLWSCTGWKRDQFWW
ncbi:hypothetical protein Pst134EA_009880 [Puccinia striiformis f. sp. tritici]|uniref:hypothetical protein n=1 Tax=Puccinia striiformis f. sp. tritici TaxID=168172 RepID=UPI0020075F6C|nr:hypothetical protein Pst134EA_009880 [Puccinia striiformis f. sp. tritici]KAH9469359.1 hypothetical protein Pst134EA_009880 [Puccinia striiformis f. sp. tritici]